MKKIVPFGAQALFTLAVLALCSGCAHQPPVSLPFAEAQPLVAQPDLIKPSTADVRLTYGDNPALRKAFNQYARTGRAPNIVTSGFVQYAYNGRQQPIIAATPYQQTVITLEPGENFTDISTADPARWTVSVADSGAGANKTVNVLLTPTIANISTNLVITTDRRMYNLKLVSTANGDYVRNVRFWYPDEMTQMLNASAEQQMQNGTIADVPGINLNQLNFSYAIAGGWIGPAWKPVRVFDDGKQTFIQMPTITNARELPALFVMSNGTQALVNYRYKAPYFVVDRIFRQAVLIAGVGRYQQRVTITNKNA